MKYKASPSTHAGTRACKRAGLVGYIHGKYHISKTLKLGAEEARGFHWAPHVDWARPRFLPMQQKWAAVERGGRQQMKEVAEKVRQKSRAKIEKRAGQIALNNLISFKQSQSQQVATAVSIGISDRWQQEEHLCEGEREWTRLQSSWLMPKTASVCYGLWH